jgi:hypothetical protein
MKTLKIKKKMNKVSSKLELRHDETVRLLKKHDYGILSATKELLENGIGGTLKDRMKIKKTKKELIKMWKTELSGDFSAMMVFTNPDTGGKRVYSGETKNGKPHGLGIDEYVDEGYKVKGEFRNGYANGQSTISWSDGSKYEGELKDGVKNGSGTYFHSDGTIHMGEWGNDNPIRIKEYKDGKILGKHYFLKNGGSSSIDDKFLTFSEAKLKKSQNKSLNN